MKKCFGELLRGAEIYQSEIIECIDLWIFVIHYTFGNAVINRFYFYNKDFTAAIGGTVECDKINESNGKSTFNMIVKTLKFNN